MNEGTKQKSILIVDDQQEVLATLQAWFLEQGFSCRTAENGHSALSLVREEAFDLVLTDIVMPGGLDGLELTRQIKAVSPPALVIIMTGFGAEFSYDEAIEAGAADFIKKPFLFPELMARIRLVQIHEDYRNLSITDDLTGLYNRRGFLTLADHLLKISMREKRGMFLLYADVDRLKEINDTFGHQEGDAALVEFGRALQNNYRQSDILARIGGDEFIVFPVGDCTDSTEVIVRRLTEVIDLCNSSRAKPYQLSVSYGIAYFDPENPLALVDLVSLADQNMYLQKKAKKTSPG
ncbi:MAG: hypothetical protein OHK006_03430 [Thermodesulfovibrionales bacterium]